MCLAHFIFSVRRTQARTRNIFLFNCQVKRIESLSAEYPLDLSWKKSQSQLKSLFVHMHFSIPLLFSFPCNIFTKFLVFTVLSRNAHLLVCITIKINIVTVSLSLFSFFFKAIPAQSCCLFGECLTHGEFLSQVRHLWRGLCMHGTSLIP